MNYKGLQALSRRRFRIPKENSIRKVLLSFTAAERVVFHFFVGLFVLSGIVLLWNVNSLYLVEIPSRGGTLTEGVVGNPRFINPVLAISEADKNLTAIIYSGLVRITPDGTVQNDLAEEVTISEDQRTYTIRLRTDARFHDGESITTDDIIFTLSKITDPIIKSPKRGNWDGVTVEKIDDVTISFTLKQPYTPFIYNLTIGILPKHIWKNVSNDEFSFSQFNTLPIGSGPYMVDTVERNSGGIPNFYSLTPFDDVTGQPPFIEEIVFRFYPSEIALIEAYNNNEVESLSGISPEKAMELEMDSSEIISSPLPRVFAVFLNQNQSKVLLDKEVRQALDLVAPRDKIIEEVFGGYGSAINGPLPAGVYSWTNVDERSNTDDEKLVEAQELLAKSGWEMNKETSVLEKKSKTSTIALSFSISTGDAPELQTIANELASAWGKLGAEVKILVFETGDLNQNVIRPRNFDALLFGEVVGRDTDLYPFWHSSQRIDPGLNIALYANNRADKLLEDARSSNEPLSVEKSYKAFTEELRTDRPAIFLYTPDFLYVVPDKIEAIEVGSLTLPQDRFLGIRDWYIETDKVWKIFTN